MIKEKERKEFGIKFFPYVRMFKHRQEPFLKKKEEFFLLLSLWMSKSPSRGGNEKIYRNGATFVRDGVIRAAERNVHETSAGVVLVSKFRRDFLVGGMVYLSYKPGVMEQKMMAQTGIEGIVFCTNQEQVAGDFKKFYEIGSRMGIKMIPYRFSEVPEGNSSAYKVAGILKDFCAQIENKMTLPNLKDSFLLWMMVIAVLSSLCSDDGSRQVGAVIFDDRFNIVGIGYNGMQVKSRDFQPVFIKKKENLSKEFSSCEKEDFSLHAEQNAVIFSNRSSIRGLQIMTTDSPCKNQCRKILCSQYIRATFLDLYVAGYGRGKKTFDEVIFTKNLKKSNDEYNEYFRRSNIFEAEAGVKVDASKWFFEVLSCSDKKKVVINNMFRELRYVGETDIEEDEEEEGEENELFDILSDTFIKYYLKSL